MFDLIDFLLAESRVDDLKKSHPDIADQIDFLSKEDPSGNNKYLAWEVKQLQAGAVPERVAIVVRRFHKSVSRLEVKDINRYKTVDELVAALDAAENKSTRRDRDRAAKRDSKVIYESDDFLVVRPLTRGASCKYGANTKWCIAANEDNQFDVYSGANALFYFIIDKRPEVDPQTAKMAIAVIRDKDNTILKREYYDSLDDKWSHTAIVDYYGDNWSELWSAIESDIDSAGPTQHALAKAEWTVARDAFHYAENPAPLREFVRNYDMKDRTIIAIQNLPRDIIETIMSRATQDVWKQFFVVHTFAFFESLPKQIQEKAIEVGDRDIRYHLALFLGDESLLLKLLPKLHWRDVRQMLMQNGKSHIPTVGLAILNDPNFGSDSAILGKLALESLSFEGKPRADEFCLELIEKLLSTTDEEKKRAQRSMAMHVISGYAFQSRDMWKKASDLVNSAY